jgi:hypothetical protein
MAAAYNWERFWSPRTAIVRFDDEGFLSDPESELGRFLNPELVSFSEILSKRCLILLGEPGSGKTQTMQREARRWRANLKDATHLTDYIDLRSFSDEGRLVQRLFHSDQFTDWRNGIRHLHIFLDSLDEALLRIHTLAAILIDELKQYPTDRLHLRIACRTAVWPALLEQELAPLWPEAEFGIYELAPLRKLDVELAAQVRGLAYDEFLGEIKRAGAVPFAIRPITLDMLFNIYRSVHSLPNDRWELYERGCALLAEELNENRQAARQTGQLTSNQRLSVASRIAAATALANRYAIWTGADTGDVPTEDVTLAQLVGYTESANGDEFQIDKNAVQETLDRGLFTSRGPVRMGWAHQTYAEFLAARYAIDHQLTLAQLKSLLIHPQQSRVIPQLQEVAAWIAGKRADVFQEIAPVDPAVLLSSDVTNNILRASLTAFLLHALDNGQLHDISADFTTQYHKLKHPDLGAQLRPYIVDRAKGPIVRRAALMIARACDQKPLGDLILGRALDKSEDEHVRALAVISLSTCGGPSHKIALKPLALEGDPNDQYDEIKGSALNLLWPEYLTAAELFGALGPEKTPNVTSSYSIFVSMQVARHLKPQDLLPAVQWAEKLPEQLGVVGDFHRAELADKIVLLAIDNLSLPDLIDAVALLFANRLAKHYYAFFPQNAQSIANKLKENRTARHHLIEAILTRLDNQPYYLAQLANWLPQEDCAWLIECAVDVDQRDGNLASKFATVASCLPYDFQNAHTFEHIFRAAERCGAVKAAFGWLFQTIELGSELADRLKANFQASQPREKPRDIIIPPPHIRILDRLQQFETGNVAAWWDLCAQLTLDPNGSHASELEPNLTSLPGWREADPATRSRIVGAARVYLETADPNTNQWIGTGNLHRPALAGYKALHLLKTNDAQSFESLSELVWERWTAAALCYPITATNQDPLQTEILSDSCRHSDAIVRIFETIIEYERQHPREISWLRIYLPLVTPGLGSRLVSRLLTLTRRAEVSPQHLSIILQQLVRSSNEAIEIALELTRSRFHDNTNGRAKAVSAAAALVISGNPMAWSRLSDLIEEDPSFLREAFEQASNALTIMDYASLLAKLDEPTLARIYIWLEKSYPRPSDADKFSEAGHVMGPADQLAQFRDSVLMVLRGKGTFAAVSELQRISEVFPQLDFLKIATLDARAVALRSTWRAPTPSDILALARRAQARLVNNGEDLLEVTIESLKRLQAEFTSETSIAPSFWDKTSDNRFRPKDEPTISDMVKRFLQDDLVRKHAVVNREVEIQRPLGSGKGPATDIHISAFAGRGRLTEESPLKAVIEVKGCWHPDLKTAIEDQLVGKYLRGTDCLHGIYLVAWFDAGWDSSDPRRKHALRWSLAEARLFFEQQAAVLSQGARVVQAFLLDCSPPSSGKSLPQNPEPSPAATPQPPVQHSSKKRRAR